LLGSPLTVAVNGWVVFTATVTVAGETETEMAGAVIDAEPVFDVSATEVAVRVSVRSLAGGTAGAL